MVKVVSCFWNAENYIEKCINSVKNQLHKNFKMYLFDYVSTDKSVEIIKKLIDGDDRFILIENKVKMYKLKNMDDLLMDESLFDDDDIIII